VLQSSGTRTESAVDIAVVAVIDDGSDKDVFVSPVTTTDADCTVHQQHTERNKSETVIKRRERENGQNINLRLISLAMHSMARLS
jgi:hypothetical protein